MTRPHVDGKAPKDPTADALTAVATTSTREGPSSTKSREGSSATLFAVNALRQRILGGSIRPGTPLSQVQLARELGVSTTPLREAMRVLQSEGLLALEPNRRARVATLDVADLDTVYAARVLMESLAITVTVEGLDDERMAAISAAHSELRRHADRRALDDWGQTHAKFHMLLVSGASAPLRAMIAGLMQRAERYRKLALLGSTPRGWGVANDEHQRIVTACLQRDASTAARELGLHLGRTALTLNAELAPEIDALGVRKSLELILARGSQLGATTMTAAAELDPSAKLYRVLGRRS